MSITSQGQQLRQPQAPLLVSARTWVQLELLSPRLLCCELYISEHWRLVGSGVSGIAISMYSYTQDITRSYYLRSGLSALLSMISAHEKKHEIRMSITETRHSEAHS